MATNKIKATIFIPTLNGEDDLERLLQAIFRQQLDSKFEVLIIDSSSTDGTLDIINKYMKKHKNLRLVVIEKQDFGHGKTRNKAAQLANGEIVVYITQDAIPSHDRWLYEFIKPFDLNKKIVGITGKQIPNPGCFPLLKYEIQSVFGNLGPDFGTTIFYKDDFVKDQGVYDAISFYSDVNSAARREYLRGKFPLKDVPYAEDQLLGRDIIDAGYYKAYAPRASVFHSNDLKLSEYKNRMFDETFGLRRLGINVTIPSKKFILKQVVINSTKDFIRIVKDGQYSKKRKIFWIFINPFFHVEKWRGVRLGAMADLSDKDMINKHSLEKKRAN